MLWCLNTPQIYTRCVQLNCATQEVFLRSSCNNSLYSEETFRYRKWVNSCVNIFSIKKFARKASEEAVPMLDKVQNTNVISNRSFLMQQNLTILPSNIRPITRECVHLVTRGHFRSRDKHNTIRSAISENHLMHANFMALCFIEPELLPIDVLHCRNRDFEPFLLLWPWPWPDDLHIRIWSVFLRDIPYVRERTSYVKAFESYRVTDRQTDRRHRG